LKEANLSENLVTLSHENWTLEKLLEEKIQFDTSLNFERKDNDVVQGWTRPAPSVPREPEPQTSTNVLCITGDSASNTLSITTADNSCNFIAGSDASTRRMISFKADSPILSTKFLQSGKFLISTSMSGKIMLHDIGSQRLIAERRDHTKWVVNLATHILADHHICLVATAGWDQKIHVYALTLNSDLSPIDKEIPPPVHTIALTTNPETAIFVTNPDVGTLHLVFSRRDSSFLYYHQIDISSSTRPTISITDCGRQNLAPHSNAWVAFTPSALALHPNDPTLLAIATSHLPYLKVIIVRLLFPSTGSHGDSEVANTAPASAARASLALQDREDAAISLQVSTQAPQTPYSTPQIAWRPDGSGVWVNGDDGVVRGVEIKTGKVVALLQAHEAGSKVRTLWAGRVGDNEHSKEVLVSGGFDRKVFIWDIES